MHLFTKLRKFAISEKQKVLCLGKNKCQNNPLDFSLFFCPRPYYLGISTHAGPGVVIPLTCLEFLPNCIDWKPKGEEPYSRLLKMKLKYYVWILSLVYIFASKREFCYTYNILGTFFIPRGKTYRQSLHFCKVCCFIKTICLLFIF